MSRWLSPACWFVLFAAAATLNAGGYRFGTSDQAFYIPAILHHLDAGLFPRDWALLAPQDQLNVFTAAAAAASRLTGLDLPSLFLVLYAAGLAALFGGAMGLGRGLYRHRWTIIALAFALTLRHAVAHGAVNTLEGYMHPRMIAFGAGALAIGAFLAERPGRAVLLVAAAFLVHPTTAIWYGAWLAAALAVSDRRFRLPVVALAAAGLAGAAWALAAGPLAGRLVRMDAAWLAPLAPKTYLFPDRWPVGTWLAMAAYPAAIFGLFHLRRRSGAAVAREGALVAGAAVLLGLFLASLPFLAARVAMAVQLQVPRALWVLDLLAVSYAVWYLAEGAPWARRGTRPAAARAVCLVLLALSLGRAGYVMLVEHPERRLVEAGLPAGEWTDAMRWIEVNTPKDAWVLASPGHAWQRGVSVRIAARRDVYLEESKDTAMAMYSRPAALAVTGRIARAAGFDALTADTARRLAAETGVDLLVTGQRLDLPRLYGNSRWHVYRLRP